MTNGWPASIFAGVLGVLRAVYCSPSRNEEEGSGRESRFRLAVEYGKNTLSLVALKGVVQGFVGAMLKSQDEDTLPQLPAVREPRAA